MNVRAGSQRRKFRCNASPTGVPIVSDWVTIFDTAVVGGATGLGTKTLRQIVPLPFVDAGTKLRLTYRCGTSVLNLTNAYVQSQAAAGDVYDFSTTPVQILFGGNAAYNFAIGETKISDDITITLDGTAPFVIATAMGAVGGMTNQVMPGAANYTKAGSDASTVDATGYTLNLSNTLTGQTKIEQYQTSLAGFPFVRGTSQDQSSSAVTSFAVTLPAGTVVGEVLLLVVANDGAQAPGLTGTAWNTIYSNSQVTGTDGFGVFWKVADGTDAATITLGVADDLAYTCYRIYGATNVSCTGATPALPVTFVAHTPAGGSKKYLWIAALGINTATTASTIPSGWNGLRTRSDGSGVGIGSWQKYLEASTITPGAYTTTTANQGHYAVTIAVAQ